MKKVDLFGYTTAQKLIAFESAINELYGDIALLGVMVSSLNYNESIESYSITSITPYYNDLTTYMNRPVLFANGWVAIINTVGNNEFTVTRPFYIKGENGIDGKDGSDGINGTNGKNGSLGAFTCIWEYNSTLSSYPVSSINNYEEPFVGQKVIFANGYIATIEKKFVNEWGEQFSVSQVYSLKGERGLTGTGIASVSSGDSYVSGNDSITPVTLMYSDSTTQELSIKTKNGIAVIPNIVITAPETAENGNLTQEQLDILQSNSLAYIEFNKEIFYPANIEHEKGYLTYVHNGFSEIGTAFVDKAITVTINTLGWILNIKTDTSKKLYAHNCTIYNESRKFWATFLIIDDYQYSLSYNKVQDFIVNNNYIEIGASGVYVSNKVGIIYNISCRQLDNNITLSFINDDGSQGSIVLANTDCYIISSQYEIL